MTEDEAMDLAYNTAAERYPKEAAERHLSPEHREVFKKLLAQVSRKLMTSNKTFADAVLRSQARADVQRFLDEKVASGEIIHLHGTKYMDAKKFFALSYDEQQKRLRGEKEAAPK